MQPVVQLPVRHMWHAMQSCTCTTHLRVDRAVTPAARLLALWQCPMLSEGLAWQPPFC